jgi:hypothetical protein
MRKGGRKSEEGGKERWEERRETEGREDWWKKGRIYWFIGRKMGNLNEEGKKE